MTDTVESDLAGFLPGEDDRTRPVLNRYDPDQAIALIDGIASDRPYSYLPELLRQFWDAVTQEFGVAGFDTVQRATLLRLQQRFETRAVGKRYTDAIRDCFANSFERIRQSIESPDFDGYRRLNDALLKDLAISAQRMFPAGAQIVEPDSGFHRALMIRAGVRQGLGMLRLLVEIGGNRPFYQLHTHSGDLGEFNPEGWRSSYHRLAGMLELNPGIKGVWSASWYFDPELVSISPRLVYLRELPQRNGASFFYSAVDLEGGALAKSPTRRRLHREGSYLPKAYALIWPRKPLLAWARSQHSA